MLLLVTISSVGTAIMYLFDNRSLLIELYGKAFGSGERS
jgi:hypothetical protein